MNNRLSTEKLLNHGEAIKVINVVEEVVQANIKDTINYYETVVIPAQLETVREWINKALPHLKKGDTIGCISDTTGILEMFIADKYGDEIPDTALQLKQKRGK